MSLAAAIKSNTLDPKRFVGRPASSCRKCRGVFHYVNRCGGIECEQCSPPADDPQVRLAVQDGVWVDASSDGFEVAQPQERSHPPRQTSGPATVPTATIASRQSIRNYVAERMRSLAAPLGAEDYQAALDWAASVSDWRSAMNMSSDEIGDALGELFNPTPTKLMIPEYVPLPVEHLEGKRVRLTKAEPCFGGTWPVGEEFFVTACAGGRRWNLKSVRSPQRGICACWRDDFEIVADVSEVADLSFVAGLLDGV